MTSTEYDLKMRELATRYKQASDILQAINLEELKREYSSGTITATQYRTALNTHTSASQEIIHIQNEVSELQKRMSSEQINEQKQREAIRQNRIKELKYKYLRLFDIIGTSTEDDLFLRYMQGDTIYNDFSKYLATHKDFIKQMRETRDEIERLQSEEKQEEKPSGEKNSNPSVRVDNKKNYVKKDGKKSSTWVKIVKAFAIAVYVTTVVGVIGLSIYYANTPTTTAHSFSGNTYTSSNGKNSTLSTPTSSTNRSTIKTENKALMELAEPYSGDILYRGTAYYGYSYYSSIKVTASKDEAVVVKLKRQVPGEKDKETVVAFYVRAGKTIEVDVPPISMYVYFAQGETWYGYDHLFGEHTAYGKDSEEVSFSLYTMEYTLMPVRDGNFTLKTTSESEFSD